ncbi:hypothetical protein RJ55_02837 [Drechmeria coniospora]|nr:hypothetical protein RJ55_02837 [Drechmeria coniospora]
MNKVWWAPTSGYPFLARCASVEVLEGRRDGRGERRHPTSDEMRPAHLEPPMPSAETNQHQLVLDQRQPAIANTSTGGPRRRMDGYTRGHGWQAPDVHAARARFHVNKGVASTRLPRSPGAPPRGPHATPPPLPFLHTKRLRELCRTMVYLAAVAVLLPPPSLTGAGVEVGLPFIQPGAVQVLRASTAQRLMCMYSGSARTSTEYLVARTTTCARTPQARALGAQLDTWVHWRAWPTWIRLVAMKQDVHVPASHLLYVSMHTSLSTFTARQHMCFGAPGGVRPKVRVVASEARTARASTFVDMMGWQRAALVHEPCDEAVVGGECQRRIVVAGPSYEPGMAARARAPLGRQSRPIRRRRSARWATSHRQLVPSRSPPSHVSAVGASGQSKVWRLLMPVQRALPTHGSSGHEYGAVHWRRRGAPPRPRYRTTAGRYLAATGERMPRWRKHPKGQFHRGLAGHRSACLMSSWPAKPKGERFGFGADDEEAAAGDDDDDASPREEARGCQRLTGG